MQLKLEPTHPTAFLGQRAELMLLLGLILASVCAVWVENLALRVGTVFLASGLPALLLLLRERRQTRQHWEELGLGLEGMLQSDTIQLSASALADGTGSSSGVLTQVLQRIQQLQVKISAQKQSLYQRRLLLEAILDSAPLALLLTDAQDRVVHASAMARDLFFSGQRIEGLPLTRVLEQTQNPLSGLLEHASDGLTELELDGRFETFEVTRRAFELEDGLHCLLMVQPMTKALDRQERQVWKQVIRTLNHELNNAVAPISSLVRSAALMHKNPIHTARLGSTLESLEKSTTRLAGFLAGYAELARLPAPSCQKLEWAPFFQQLSALMPFTWEGTPAQGTGFADPAQLQQVLVNLLKNATEAGGPPEAIGVSYHRLPKGGYAIEVLDRGTGMSPDTLRKAVLPYFTTKKTGSGLGLPLCREILEGHGGELRLEHREGGGMRVRCLLPGPPNGERIQTPASETDATSSALGLRP